MPKLRFLFFKSRQKSTFLGPAAFNGSEVSARMEVFGVGPNDVYIVSFLSVMGISN